MRRGKRLVLVGALFTVACTAVGIAYAAIPDANNVIHGCVSKGDGGGLRVVDTDRGQSCKTGELAVNWNQAGPKGLDGAPGKDGAAGPPGPPGSSTPARPAIGTLTATGQKQGPIPATGADPIVGMDWGVVSPTDPASGLATGRRQHKPFVITKELDASTPLFLSATYDSENLTQVMVGLVHQGEASAYMTIKLTNAHISSVHQFAEGGKQYEEIAFTYQKITHTYVDGGVTAEDDWQAPTA